MPWWLWLMAGLALGPLAAIAWMLWHAIRGDWWMG